MSARAVGLFIERLLNRVSQPVERSRSWRGDWSINSTCVKRIVVKSSAYDLNFGVSVHTIHRYQTKKMRPRDLSIP